MIHKIILNEDTTVSIYYKEELLGIFPNYDYAAGYLDSHKMRRIADLLEMLRKMHLPKDAQDRIEGMLAEIKEDYDFR